MSKLDPRIEAIRVKYGLEASDFWELPQKKGTWIAKHSALEIVAAKANIVWAMPQIIEANSGDGIAAMVVMGTLESRSEWATGEASNKNNKNAYPWAMAEKRGKDRVVLKLSGIAGLVYSEDEADDFKQPADTPPKPSTRPVETGTVELTPQEQEAIDKIAANIDFALEQAGPNLAKVWKENWSTIQALPKHMEDTLTRKKDKLKANMLPK